MKKIISLVVAILFVGLALTACVTVDPTVAPSSVPTEAPTPTPVVEYDTFVPSVSVPDVVTAYVPAEGATMLYVDAANGNDTADGSASAPWKTIEHARDAVRALIPTMSADIVINLTGEFFLEDTFTLTDADGGANGFDVVYRSNDGTRALVSGGLRVSGWTLHDSENNIWSVSVPDGLTSRNFFVNGTRAERAGTAKAETYDAKTFNGTVFTKAKDIVPGLTVYKNDYFSITDTSYLSFEHPEDLELVFLWGWRNPHVPVTEVVDLGGCVTFKISELADSILIGRRAHAYGEDFTLANTLYQINNAYELLDEPGEFYLNTHNNTLYYIPRAGEDMATADTILGRLETIVSAIGSRNDTIDHIRFDSIDFMHSEWNPAALPEGHIDIQAGFYKGGNLNDTVSGVRPTASLMFKFAHYISIVNCTVAHTGNCGIDFNSSTQNVIIAGNELYDCGNNGIMLGGNDDSSDFMPSKYNIDKIRSTDNYIIDNYIHNVGTVFMDSVGIMRGYTYNTVIAYNSITDNPYDAMSIGWGWGHGGTDLNATETQFKYGVFSGNAVVCNYINNSPTTLLDGGSIYTLGRQDGMVIEGNYVRNSAEMGIYLDNGSNGIIVRYNVLENVIRNFVIRGQSNTVCNNYTEAAFQPNAIQPELGGVFDLDFANCSESEHQSIMHSCGARSIAFTENAHPFS